MSKETWKQFRASIMEYTKGPPELYHVELKKVSGDW
jgi:hypothetical protein